MFSYLDALPADPLLGLIAAYKKDPNPNKVDLGVGIYRDEGGETPVLEAVKIAEKKLLETESSKAYVGAVGNEAFNHAIAALTLGGAHSALAGRVKTLQTPGGCGALRVAAELLVRADSKTKLWVSNPTWANHVPLLGNAGLQIQEYRYYDYEGHRLDFEGMLEDLETASEGDVVLLHGCCHNPCGADLSFEQWQLLLKVLQRKRLMPLVDMAYQGFGQGLDDDAYGARLLAANLPELLVCVSCSKNFGLYRERVGAVIVIAETDQQASTAMSHLCSITRGIYSMPPSHGASIVAQILDNAELTGQWHAELSQMRSRIQGVRSGLKQGLSAQFGSRFHFIEGEQGMFSFLGCTPAEVQRLASDYSIYMAGSSRINLAGLNPFNIEYCVDAFTEVIS
jgi:aspartate aminotransferase